MSQATKQEKFRVVALDALVQMQLVSFRNENAMHIRDMVDVGLIDPTWTARLPSDLETRLQLLIDTPEGESPTQKLPAKYQMPSSATAGRPRNKSRLRSISARAAIRIPKEKTGASFMPAPVECFAMESIAAAIRHWPCSLRSGLRRG